MDDLDRRLLNAVQRGVPLVREPFDQLADELDCDADELIRRLEALRGDDGVIREISAIFHAPAMGYRQALVAMRTPADRLDAAGEAAAGHPGVSHCYARDGEVNLWLTLAVSPASRLGLERTARILAADADAGEPMVLPTLRRYKLRVQFDMTGSDDSAPPDAADAGGVSAEATGAAGRPPEITDEQLRAVRTLQRDLPAEADPFARLAADKGLDPDMLLVHAADFLAAGWMRRYAAVLRHRRAGRQANLLVAWKVPEPAADAEGARAARMPAVSHCYLRPTAEGWPYNLYTMIHGRSAQDCELAVEELVATTNLSEHVELWTTKEYKKRRVRLFSSEEATWEAAHATQ